MTDHIWATKVGTLLSLKHAIKFFQSKKMVALGFSVEMDELDEKANQRLILDYKKYNDFKHFGKDFIIIVPHKQLLDDIGEVQRDTTKRFYVARFIGPRLLNGVPREDTK